MKRRMEQINELLQQELSKIIQQEVSKDNQGLLLTVQEVQAAEDLKTAKVWVSVFGSNLADDIKDEMIKKLQKKSFQFQKELNSRLDLKFIPKLTFKLDTSGEIIQKIDQTINNLNK